MYLQFWTGIIVKVLNFYKYFFVEGIQEKLAIGEEYCITVNADQAGQGAVTCKITSKTDKTTSDVNIEVEDNGDGTFSIYYRVKDAGDYSLNVKFGGQPVPGGNYSFSVSFSFLISKHVKENGGQINVNVRELVYMADSHQDMVKNRVSCQ